MDKFINEIAHSTGIDAALNNIVDDVTGVRLFTVLQVDWDSSEAERIFTNMPDAYPLSGRKPLGHDDFTKALVYDAKTMVMNTIEEIAEHFPDHALIESLGCQSCLNIPLVLNNKVIGAMNFLDKRNHWTSENIATAKTLRPAGLIYLLSRNAGHFLP